MRRRSAEPSKAARRFVGSTESRPAGEIRVGISGWRYPGWRGRFYPRELPQHRELEFASGAFNSVEINGSFYSLQLPSSYERWYAEQLYVSGYTDAALDWWAARIERWRRGTQPHSATLAGTSRRDVRGRRRAAFLARDVFVYFDNDAKVHAPFDAIQLAKRLRVGWSPPARD